MHIGQLMLLFMGSLLGYVFAYLGYGYLKKVFGGEQ